MQILKTSKFFTEIEAIIDFIAQDSFNRAENTIVILGIFSENEWTILRNNI